MHLVALVEGPGHVCCRYRLEAFRPRLEAAGHSLDIRPLPRSWWARWGLFRELRGADVLLQRFLLPGWQLACLRASARRLFFDLDDSVFLRDSYSRRGLHSPRRLRRFAATARACDAILAGNSFLLDHAARWAGVHRAHLVPTCVDPARYHPADHARAGDVQLVWVGSSSTLRGLERIAPLLEHLGCQLPGLSLKLVCDTFLSLRHLGVVPCPWDGSTEADALADSDVGISWMPHDDWSRGKCGLKVLQYMAAGLPVVANPVGVHLEMVRHGETGYLAETPDEWVAAVRRLARDPALRRRMGSAGRRLIETRYSVASGAERWLAVLGTFAPPLARAG